MFVITRSGKKEPVKFDKITLRISKLTYGLNNEFVDAMEVAKRTIQGLFDGITRAVPALPLHSSCRKDQRYLAR